MIINFREVTDMEIDGVDTKDYPDFCDAFIGRCLYYGEEATDEELEYINAQADFIHELAYESLI